MSNSNPSESSLSSIKDAAGNAVDAVEQGAQQGVEAAGDALGAAKDAVQTVSGTQESKNMALLIWLGTIFFGFIPGLIFYLVKEDDAFIKAHAKENLNFSITYIIAFLVCSIVPFVGWLLLPVVLIAYWVFCVMGAVKGSKGEMFEVPFIFRLIK